MPYFVATKMSKVRKPSLFIPSPETYVKSALSKVGVSEVTNGYWPHSLQVCIGLIIFNTNVQVLNIRIHVYTILASQGFSVHSTPYKPLADLITKIGDRLYFMIGCSCIRNEIWQGFYGEQSGPKTLG